MPPQRCVPSPDNHCKPEDYDFCGDVVRMEGDVFSADEIMITQSDTGEDIIRFLAPDDLEPDGARRPVDRDNPKTPENDSEIDMAVYNGHISERGYDGICKKLDPSKARGDSDYRWFAYSGLTNYLIFRNEEQGRCVMLDKADIALGVAEMQMLVPLLGLSVTDIAIKPGRGPQMQPDGGFSAGLYHFTNDETRLQQMRDTLGKAVEETERLKLLTAMKGDLQKTVALEHMLGLYKRVDEHLAKVNEAYDVGMEAVDSQETAMGFGTFVGLGSLIFTGVLLWIFRAQFKLSRLMLERQDQALEMQRKMMEGDSDKNRLEKFSRDLVAEQRKTLAADVVSNEIRGRDSEALEFLRRLARPRYANPLIVAKSGVGKDKVVERAAQLIAMRDHRVPAQFRDGTIKGLLIIDPSAFTANTGIRGDSSARANEIIKAMRAGYAVYFPELADFLSAGAARDGASESLASQLKDELPRGTARFAGSTTPDSFQSLVRTIPWLKDIERRMPPMELADLHIDTIRDIVPEAAKPFYEKYYEVKLPEATVRRAIDLALHNMPGESAARMDAIDQLLVASVEKAVIERRNGGEVVVEVADVEAIIRERGIEPQKGPFEDTTPPKSAEEMRQEKSFSKELKRQLAAQPWFHDLSRPAQREIVRKAGSMLFGEGGERYHAEVWGLIDSRQLARDLKAAVTELPEDVRRGTAAAQPAAADRDAEVGVADTADARREREIEKIRDRMLEEARKLRQDGKVRLNGADFSLLTEADQRAMAEHAHRIWKADWKKYSVVEEGQSVLKPGAGMKLMERVLVERGDAESAKFARKGTKRVERLERKGRPGFLRRAKDKMLKRGK